MNEEKATCSNCGQIEERFVMFEVTPGRKTHLLCPKCYLKGMHDTKASAIRRYSAMKYGRKTR